MWLAADRTGFLVQLTNEFDLDDADHEVKIRELHKQLESLTLRPLKRDVLTSSPTKSERILRVEMSTMKIDFYKNILTKVRAHLSLVLCRPDLAKDIIEPCAPAVD